MSKIVNLIVVNLLNPEEAKKLASLNGSAGIDAINKDIENGRTSLVFDLSNGDVLLVVQNGELLYADNENINFKSIL
jgi:hypothetical protein